MKTIVTWWSVVIAFGISPAVVGVVFGLCPATATALEPIGAMSER